MSDDGVSGGGDLQATMAVQFVECDGRIFVIFEAELGQKLIHVGVSEVSPGIIEHTTRAAAQRDTPWAMSEEDVEIVRTAFAAFGRGDIDAVLRLCADDIVITQPPELPGVSPEQHGHRGVLEAFAIWPEQWEDYRIEILRIAAAPADGVFVTTRTRGRGRQSGVEVEMDISFAFTIRDARISEMRIFMRENDALEAAGLSE